jgi:hypothetical protein|tara:strand:- start:530 stop:862 length:333 start_codon:yes stop_codon:yes gene_type:complete
MADFYNPSDLTTEDLLKRVKVSNQARDFIRSSTGTAVCERAIGDYHKAISSLQKIAVDGWRGSQEEELNEYRAISNSLATPLKLLQWLDATISDGEKAEVLSRYKDAGEL